MDLSSITNPEARRFANTFFMYRNINREFYENVPEDKFDFRIVDTQGRKSDSPRDSLAHQINVQRSYLCSIADGKAEHIKYYDADLKTLSKEKLLKELEKAEQKLIDFLSVEENLEKLVIVKWSPTPIKAISYLWALNDHEIFHNGWNVAVMDHLNMERFPALKRIWG